MGNTIDEIKKIITTAKRKAHKNGHADNMRPCPICWIKGVVEVLGEGDAYCHLCKEKLYNNICARCEKEITDYSSYKNPDECCHNCIEAAGDEYISDLIDLKRGK